MRALARILAAALLLGPIGQALAQGVSLPAHPDINVTGFSGDPNALASAISAIEAASGGRVVEIRYNNVSGAPGYDVVVARGPQVLFQRFSRPGAGLVTMTDQTKPAWMLKWPARTDVALLTKAKVPLVAAIRTAEASQPGGPAVAAGIARSASNPDSEIHAYNVILLRGGQLRRVAVDSDSGQMIEDPQALAY